MKQANGSMIIYCATKKEVARLYQIFRSRFAVGYYHGGVISNSEATASTTVQSK